MKPSSNPPSLREGNADEAIQQTRVKTETSLDCFPPRYARGRNDETPQPSLRGSVADEAIQNNKELDCRAADAARNDGGGKRHGEARNHPVLPEGWAYCNFSDCLEKLHLPVKEKLQTKDYQKSGHYPIIDQGQDLIAGWTDTVSSVISEPLPLIIFGDHTRAFKYVNFPFARGADGTQLLKPIASINVLYFYYVCLFIDIQNRGYNRHYSILKEKIVPIANDKKEQIAIAKSLELLDNAIKFEKNKINNAQDLKRAAMREVFTRGLRGEAQKTKVSLESLCALISQQVHPRDNPKAVYIGLEHLSSGMFHQDNFGIAEDVQSSKFYFKKGDVLYSKLRPYLDKAILADFEGLCTTELLVLRPKNNIPATFLIGVVHFQDFIEYAMAGVAGAQHPRTSWHHIKNYQIPEFSPEEQREIGTLLSAIDDKITLHKRKKAALEALFTSLLHQLMTGEIRVGDLDISPLNTPQTEAV
jgi:type I restriction enzyme S subunit